MLTPRYREIYEYYKSLPKAELYEEDNTKGHFINITMKQRYYNNVAKKLDATFEEKEKK